MQNLNKPYTSFQISQCDDNVPSLLLELDKNIDLPDGTGKTGFVILPENIHPHIRQNLTYYLARIGIPLGVDVVPTIDNEFKKLK